eukprot:8648260-Pyramimonas_sp.AAC.1
MGNWVLFDGVLEHLLIQQNASERQGTPEAPAKWNVITQSIFGDLASSWKSRGMGVLLLDEIWTHLCWADNFFLLSGSAEHAAIMLQELTTRMSTYGLYWKKGSLEYISPDPHAPE